MKNEIWVPVVGYEGLYEVSSFGMVRSLGNDKSRKTKILTPVEDGCGYFRVGLCKKGKVKKFKVHRLVAKAFIPNWFDDPHVNHIDENKHNNNVDNLEWCTASYNNSYGTRIKRVSKRAINGKCSKSVIQMTKTGELVREWPSVSEAGRNGFNIGNIISCCREKLKHYKGFIWRYKEVS